MIAGEMWVTLRPAAQEPILSRGAEDLLCYSDDDADADGNQSEYSRCSQTYRNAGWEGVCRR